jgi:hypothetical protein
MPLYFAYGANMGVEAMARRCPRSQPLGLARLMRHRLAVMREGGLTATRDAKANVEGVLWRIALADGLFVKATQPVVVAGGAKRALIYFGANGGPGVAEADYIAGVLDAARRCNLPGAAIAQLERFAAEADVAVPSRAAPASAAKSVRPRFATPFDRA